MTNGTPTIRNKQMKHIKLDENGLRDFLNRSTRLYSCLDKIRVINRYHNAKDDDQKKKALQECLSHVFLQPKAFIDKRNNDEIDALFKLAEETLKLSYKEDADYFLETLNIQIVTNEIKEQADG